MTSDLHVRSQQPPALREIIALSLACLAYSVLSFLAKAPESVAVAHAHDVATFESRIGIFIEGSANTWLTAHPLLASLASAQYAVSFLAMTGFALVTLWRKAPTHYRRRAHHLLDLPACPPTPGPRSRLRGRRRRSHVGLFSPFRHARQSLRCNAINAYGLVRLGRSDARNLCVALMVGAADSRIAPRNNDRDNRRNGQPLCG